jgi:hypothetical protein
LICYDVVKATAKVMAMIKIYENIIDVIVVRLGCGRVISLHYVNNILLFYCRTIKLDNLSINNIDIFIKDVSKH